MSSNRSIRSANVIFLDMQHRPWAFLTRFRECLTYDEPDYFQISSSAKATLPDCVLWESDTLPGFWKHWMMLENLDHLYMSP